MFGKGELSLFCLVLFCVFRLGFSGYCTKATSCSASCSRRERSTTSCWLIFRCSQYRTTYYSCTKTCTKSSCCIGYTGSSCATPLCYGATTCPNGGTCVSPNNCVCRSGFTGSRCSDDNECNLNNGGCQHHCQNTAGSFRCSCRTGYTLGSDGKSCRDINECMYSYGGCQHKCINEPGTYQCDCHTGYRLDINRKTCHDIDECTTGAARCGQICKNTVGSYECSCRVGYRLLNDKRQCEEIDECVEGTHACQHLCTNTPGSFKCSCSEGFELKSDGRSCTAMLLCGTPADNCSQICIDSPGYFTCDCRSGYKLQQDGRTCSDIDECGEGTSGCSQNCTNTEGSFTCSCIDGHMMDQDGKTCLDIDDCEGITCSNGGTCVDGFKSYVCRCAQGFTGNDCEQDINECSILNGGCHGICTNELGSFSCSCTGNTTLADDGFTCKGQDPGVDIFRRFELLGKLLPKGCFFIELASCSDGEDIAVHLSSTSDWFIAKINTSVTFTSGIVFVEVNNLAIPVSLNGVMVITDHGQFSINRGNHGLTASDGLSTGTRRETNCFAIDFTPADLSEFISSNSFLISIFDAQFSVLPNFLQLSGVNSSIINVNNLRTDLVYGRDMAGVEDCSGAPVLDNHLYSVFRFATNFELSLYGNNINVPKPLQNKQFCLIVDICQNYGGTVFLMIPESSNTALTELEFFKTLRTNQGLSILPKGIGLSLVNEINVRNFKTELTFWNGDQFFTYPVFQQSGVWIGGSFIKESTYFRVEAEVDTFMSVPRVDRILTGVFVDEWESLTNVRDISLIIRFRLFGAEFAVNLGRILETNVNVYMSFGGTVPRKWCGDTSYPGRANPPGLYASAKIAINPFQGVPILGDWSLKNTHTLYAFFTTDPNITNDTKINVIEEIKELKEDIERLEKFLKETVNSTDSLKNETKVDIRQMYYTTRSLKVYADDYIEAIQGGNVENVVDYITTLNKKFKDVHVIAQTLYEKVKLYRIDVRDEFILKTQMEIHTIQKNIDNAVKALTDQVTTKVSNYDSFGFKYTMSISILNLDIIEADIEVVISQDVMARCSRFEKAFKLLEGQKAVRVLGRLSRETSLGYFLKAKRGLGLGAAFSADSNVVVVQLTVYAKMLGFTATVDLFLQRHSLFFYLEGNLWNIFLVQVEVSAIVQDRWHEITFSLSGRFVAKARRRRQNQSVSESFQSSYLDALIKATQIVANEVEKRISKAQNALTVAQQGITKAQNWLDNKKEDVRSANSAFDKAVAALESAKNKLEEAKRPFEKALEKLSAAQRKVDNLCQIKSCSKVCIPGIKCRICTAKIGWIRIPLPCCKFTKCMISFPNPLCVAANLLCKIVRAAAFLALEVAKLIVRAPMIAFDIAKGVVSVAQIAIDKSRVVLFIAEGALDLAKGTLYIAKGLLEVAKATLETLKYIVRGALKILEFVIEHGLQKILDVKNCGFDIQLSTTDLPVFDVSCEVNAFKLGWKKIQIRIDFRNILQSIWNAAKATIQNFVNVLSDLFSGRRRRNISFESSAKVIKLLRSIRDVDPLQDDISNHTIEDVFNVVNATLGMDESVRDTYESRIKLFQYKCNITTDAAKFLYDGFMSLFIISNETKFSFEAARNVTQNLDGYNEESFITGLTLENANVSEEYAANVYNLTKDTLDKAVEDSKASIRDDPLIAETLAIKQFSSESIKSEIANIESVSLIEQWVFAMENASIDYYNEDECTGFHDCILFAFERLYSVFEEEDRLPNISRIKDLVMDLEEDIMFVFDNTSKTADNVFDIADGIISKLEQLENLNIYCSTAPRFISVLSNKTTITGTSISFRCDVESNPTATHTWFKDGEEVVGVTSNKLVLVNVTEDDAGPYSCIAGNVVANLSSEEVFLTVLRINDNCEERGNDTQIDDGNCRTYLRCLESGYRGLCCCPGYGFDPQYGTCVKSDSLFCKRSLCPEDFTKADPKGCRSGDGRTQSSSSSQLITHHSLVLVILSLVVL